MAGNDFLPIATGTNAFVLSQEAYEAHPHRIAGQQSGVASAELNNKALRQGASMASAIGRFIAAAGYDARDDGDIQTLQANFAAAVAALIAPSIASAVTAAKKNVLETVFPVGSFYISASSATSPTTRLGFGTWEIVSGQFLLAANSAYPAGSSGGEASHKLAAAEMPSHTHNAATTQNGSHSHSASIGNSGEHYHGSGVGWDRFPNGSYGCYDGAYNHVGFDGGDTNNPVWKTSINGSHSHSANIHAAGAHTHTVNVDSTGGNAPHNNMPPYLSVYMWRRTA